MHQIPKCVRTYLLINYLDFADIQNFVMATHISISQREIYSLDYLTNNRKWPLKEAIILNNYFTDPKSITNSIITVTSKKLKSALLAFNDINVTRNIFKYNGYCNYYHELDFPQKKTYWDQIFEGINEKDIQKKIERAQFKLKFNVSIALENFCFNNHLELVKWLLNNYSVDKFNERPLIFALMNGNCDLAIFLCKKDFIMPDCAYVAYLLDNWVSDENVLKFVKTVLAKEHLYF